MNAPPTLHLVVGCTDRKLRATSPELRLGARPTGELDARVQDWIRALESSEVPETAAESLYGGDHWSVVRSIASERRPDLAVNVWIASGGYGLVGLDTPLRAYGATFADGHTDSVAPANSTYSVADWWDAIAQWRPVGHASARSVRELAEQARQTPQSFVLLALSEPYVEALARDIGRARDLLPERLATISVGGATVRDAEDAQKLNLIRADARLKGLVGGAMHAINARVARKAIAEYAQWYPTFGALQQLVDHWMSEAPPMPIYNRDRKSDDEVRVIIADALKKDPRMSHTRLLRDLRAAGQACEQGRFRALFKEVRDASTAGEAGARTTE